MSKNLGNKKIILCMVSIPKEEGLLGIIPKCCLQNQKCTMFRGIQNLPHAIYLIELPKS